jgi:hypothetical protein
LGYRRSDSPAGEIHIGKLAGALVPLTLLTLGLATCGGGSSTSSTSGEASSASSKNVRSEDIREFGAEAKGGEAKQAEAVVRSYLDARAAGKWSEACSYIAAPIRHVLAKVAASSKQAKGDSCAASVRSSTQKLTSAQRADLADPTFDTVRVEAGKGYVFYTGASGADRALRVSEEGGRWKVAALSGASLGGAS